MELDNLNLDCAASVEELRQAGAALAKLARYAELKARAMEYRAAGNVRVAASLESRCDSIFARLPAGFKW